MKIFYDSEKTKEINQRIWEKWGNTKKEWAKHGYNVSEVSACEVKCYCNRTGIEQKHAQKDVGFLVFGIVAEQVVMAIYPEGERQYEANLNELVWGHMDAFENLRHPIEGKATAKRIFKACDIPEIWSVQLLNYMTMTNSTVGWLFILDIFTRQFSAFRMELTNDDKLLQIEAVMGKVTKFDRAISAKDPSTLAINPREYELCGWRHDCPRRLECKEKHGQLKKESTQK